jgi:hypothetical protein
VCSKSPSLDLVLVFHQPHSARFFTRSLYRCWWLGNGNRFDWKTTSTYQINYTPLKRTDSCWWALCEWRLYQPCLLPARHRSWINNWIIFVLCYYHYFDDEKRCCAAVGKKIWGQNMRFLSENWLNVTLMWKVKTVSRYTSSDMEKKQKYKTQSVDGKLLILFSGNVFDVFRYYLLST